MYDRQPQFTPGPWAIHQGHAGYYCQGDIDGQSVEIVFRCEDIGAADAHLIETAPKLYEIARWLVWKVKNEAKYEVLRNDPIIQMAEKALLEANPVRIKPIWERKRTCA